MSISVYDCMIADFIVGQSGAGQLLRDALRRDPRGGKLRLDPETYLKGMLLSAMDTASTYLTHVHHVLTQEVPEVFRLAWGVDYHDGNHQRQVTYDDFKNMSRRIQKHLDYSPGRCPDLPACQCPEPPERGSCSQPNCQGTDMSGERARRQAAIQSILDAMIGATRMPRPANAHDYAIDSTGLWAHERARGTQPELDEDGNAQASPPAPEQADLTAEVAGRRKQAPSDAGWGTKTSKSGARTSFYGYEVHAVVRVPEQHPQADIGTEPALLQALRLTPASTDIVEPTLSMIDQVIADGHPIRNVLVDRHYSYKRFDRWLLKLTERGIHQVIDLREDEQGFRSWDGIPFAASWAHCPGTPAHLGVIPTLPPNATPTQVKAFESLIDQRWAYAAQRSSVLTSDGKTRYRCPCRAGKIGCSLVPGSEQAAVNLGLPIVANPPSPDQAPALCTQGTWGAHITTEDHKVIMKGYQEHYWGSPKQRQLYGRRTFVEMWFSILKAPNSAGKNRESSLHRGLAMVSLEVGIFGAIANMIRLRAWYRAALQSTHLAQESGKDLDLITPTLRSHLLLRNLTTTQTAIPMTEEEWLQKVDQATAELKELTAHDTASEDAA